MEATPDHCLNAAFSYRLTLATSVLSRAANSSHRSRHSLHGQRSIQVRGGGTSSIWATFGTFASNAREHVFCAVGRIGARRRNAAQGPRGHPRKRVLRSCPGAPPRRSGVPSTVRADRRPPAPPLVGQHGASGGCARASSREASQFYRRCRNPLPASPTWGHPDGPRPCAVRSRQCASLTGYAGFPITASRPSSSTSPCEPPCRLGTRSGRIHEPRPAPRRAPCPSAATPIRACSR